MDRGHIPHFIKKVMTKNQQKMLELKLLDKWRNQIREVGLEVENEEALKTEVLVVNSLDVFN